MKTSTFFVSLSLAAGAVAQLGKAGLGHARDISFEARQVQSILDVVSSINDKAGDLDTAIKSYTGGDPSKILSASKALNSVVSSGVDTVKGASTISTADALQVQPAVQTLTTTVNGTIKDLIAKKSQIVSAGQGGATEDQLTTQLQGAKDLSAAISSKVPSSLSSLATQLSAGITDAIQSGVDAFKGTGSSSSSSSSASGTSSSASGASSSANGASSSTDSASSSTGSAASSTATTAMSSTSTKSTSTTETSSTSTETGGSSSASSSSPAQSTGAASTLHKFEGFGFLALVVAALAI